MSGRDPDATGPRQRPADREGQLQEAHRLELVRAGQGPGVDGAQAARLDDAREQLLGVRVVARDEDGMRLDRWFQTHFPQVTFGHLQKLLRSGQVRVDSGRVKTNARLASGQVVRVPPIEAAPELPDGAISSKDAEFLRDLGYTVLEAADGRAALQRLRSGTRPDVLVTDVGLPGGLNGRQVADAARERWPDLPVLFITGYAGATLDGQLAPGMAVMGKPFALDALAAQVQAMLDAAPRR